ncbi:MAG: O-antigen ligase family protein [Betaproteobacteria bacterium]
MNLVTPAAWCAALFIAASLFSHTVALRLLLLFGGVLLLVAETIRSRLRKAGCDAALVPPLLWPFALWAAWAAASFLWTLDPGLTRKEFQNEIVYAFLAFWLCFVAAQAPRAGRIVGVAAAGALAVCEIAHAQSATQRHNPLQLHRGPGAFSSTRLSLYTCTLAFAWLAAARRWNKAWIALALGLVPLYFASGYATQNRTLWIGFAVETLLFAALLLARPSQRRHGSLALVAVAGLLIVGIAVALSRVEAERSAAGGGAANDPRPALWKTVIGKIEERPLTGAGFGRGMFRQELRAQAGSPQIWHSHNLFVDTAVQLGLPGLALLVLLFGWTAALAWRLARSSSDVAFACGLALLPLVAGTIVRNLTDVLWVRQSALLYWAAVGVLLGWGLRAQRGAR